MCIRDRYDSERYIERNREVEIFKICRNYEEFIERLGGERSENNNKYLPCNETEVVGENENNDFTKYLIVTDYTKGDMTIPDHELYEIVENYRNLNSMYIDCNNIIHSILNHVYSFKIRLLFDDGG